MHENKAITIVGLFIALHYVLAIINGLIVGRWISYINALIVGIILQALSILIVYKGGSSFYWGCALFLAGSLPSSSSINMIITERFGPHDTARERVFMWNYSAMNLGNIIGYTIAGYFQILNNFHQISYINISLMFVALILSILYKKHLGDIHSNYTNLNSRMRLIGFIKFTLVILILTVVIKEILFYSKLSDYLIIGMVSLSLIFFLIYNCRNGNKHGIIFITLAMSYLLFWALYFMIPTGLTLFANYSTNGKILGYLVPPAWLQNINSSLIILGAPLLALFFKIFDKKHHWTAISKFCCGLLLMAISFLFLIVGIIIAKFQLVNLIWLMLTYTFLTFSELFIAPVGFAAVGKYVSRQNQGIMTGIWMSILGLGGLLASQLSNTVKISGTNIIQMNEQFFKLFTLLFGVVVIFSIFLYFFNQYFKKS
jgi:POT family proton-dependent oligopeptide transporter